MNSKKTKLDAFSRLLDIMDDLRSQCPWDQKQTFESLRHLTIEETYELGDAILDRDLTEIKKELGDLLLHIVFYAKLGSEEKAFDIADIANDICEKLIYRHPHIYGSVSVEDEHEVKKNWEVLKLKEGKKSVLEGVPNGLPAMIKAQRMQEKAAGVGFDWEHKTQVWGKFEEELKELNQALDSKKEDEIEDEFGDVLFSLIIYARFF
jgi:XTP/dITP diphosphohydrolase